MNQLTLDRPATSASGLNQGQQAAADACFQFLFNPDKEFGISGPGGVGKTHWMGHIIDVVIPRYIETCKLMGVKPLYEEVHMTATTNKATEELSHSTKKPCDTIHSYMGLKVTNDFKSGRTKLLPSKNWSVKEKKILFVDECSMIDTQLYNYLQEGTRDCKVIYVGDHCQLAPVMETSSPVFKRGITFHNLTEPMRTKIPELHALNQQLRNTVETGRFEPIKLVPGIIDHFDDTRMQAALAAEFRTKNRENLVVAYTNNRVVEFNDHIRDLRALPDTLTLGEFVVNNTAVHLADGKMLTVDKAVEIVAIGPSEYIAIEDGVNMEIRKMDLKSVYGGVYTDVMVPVDREHHQALIKHYKNLKAWEKFFYLRDYFADLRPSDASTVYKAQGSSKTTVFIDAGNISTCTNTDQVARQLYVAASRARARVIFYGNLPPKFGGFAY